MIFVIKQPYSEHVYDLRLSDVNIYSNIEVLSVLTWPHPLAVVPAFSYVPELFFAAEGAGQSKRATSAVC